MGLKYLAQQVSHIRSHDHFGTKQVGTTVNTSMFDGSEAHLKTLLFKSY